MPMHLSLMDGQFFWRTRQPKIKQTLNLAWTLQFHEYSIPILELPMDNLKALGNVKITPQVDRPGSTTIVFMVPWSGS